jgi:hypothetical protein
MRQTILCLLLVILSACETGIDPVTGATRTRLTLPLTQAAAESAERRWWECVQFRSESWCERNLPNGRPPGISPVDTPPTGQGGYIGSRRDP